MTKKKDKRLGPKLQPWVDARKRHHLSHAHVQMARELGMNPAKLGSLDNHRQEPWKAPLPEFIEQLYEKRFGKTRPDVVTTIEQIATRRVAANDARRSPSTSVPRQSSAPCRVVEGPLQSEPFEQTAEMPSTARATSE